MSVAPDNHDFMCEAIREMELSTVEPRVGAVIVKDGQIIARGHRSTSGHAERVAIESAIKARINLKGTVIFTTLEPCIQISSNPEKKSCCELIKEARIATVFIGSYDPNSRINRKGWKYLKDNKIEVKDFSADLRHEIEDKNSSFKKYFTDGNSKKGGEISGAEFDYMQNGGAFNIYYPDSTEKFINTRWTLCGIDAIYAYANPPYKVALAKYATQFEEIDDCSAYDFSFHSQRIGVGEIAIFLNPVDQMAILIKVKKVTSGLRYGSDTTSVKIEFTARSY